jgi:TRAP-type mannitol/chloroaromatic compound transport system substrate-binding protein
MTGSKAKKPQEKTSRRKFIMGAGAIATTGLLAACGNAGSDGGQGSTAIITAKRKLKMVTTWPKNFPGMGVSAERFAERIFEATDGNIDIEVYGGGELVPALGAFDAVSSGNADIYHGAEYYWQGKSKAFNFFAAVPFGMTANEMSAWIYHDGGQELWDELAAPFNIKPMLGGSTGTQMGGWFREEVNSVNDFKGLRMRIPGLGGEVISRLGATPVTKAGGEIFLALSQGNIDATEWVGPWNDMAFGFQEIVKNYYYPGFHEPGTSLGIGFNKDIWESFTLAQRSIITSAAQAEQCYTQAEYNIQNAHALYTLINEHGVKVRPFSDEILIELNRISQEVLVEISKSDPLTARVYESFKSSMLRTSKWGDIAEQAYLAARRLDIG